jgi:hypothetical protein
MTKRLLRDEKGVPDEDDSEAMNLASLPPSPADSPEQKRTATETVGPTVTTSLGGIPVDTVSGNVGESPPPPQQPFLFSRRDIPILPSLDEEKDEYDEQMDHKGGAKKYYGKKRKTHKRRKTCHSKNKKKRTKKLQKKRKPRK